jgi:hypothetical protein
MLYPDFENIMSFPRLNRYKTACQGNTKKAMALYRHNLRLSQEIFTIISCFEIALRNAIDKHYLNTLGNHWLKDGATSGGIFDNPHCRITKSIIMSVFSELGIHYTHSKLMAKMDFGFWRYQFAPSQYRAAGSSLLHIFPLKPSSTYSVHYNWMQIDETDLLYGLDHVKNVIIDIKKI